MLEKLFQLAFNKAKDDSPKKSHSGIISYLVANVEVLTKLKFEDRNVRKYYTALKNGEIKTTPNIDLVQGLSLYLGFKDYPHFIRKNSTGTKTLSSFTSAWIKGGSPLQAQATKSLSNTYNFSLSVRNTLSALFPKLINPHSRNFYNFYSLDFADVNIEFGFKLIYTENQNFDVFLWELEQVLFSFVEVTEKPWTFYIISNLVLTTEQRIKVTKTVSQSLNQYDEIEFFYFFDFDEFISKSIRDFSSNLMDVFILQNEGYKSRIKKMMDKDIFLREVPYHPNQDKKNTNPFNYITHEVLSNIDSREMFESHVLLNANKKSSSRSTSLSFLVAEFGYGKTTLLLQLASQLPEQFDLIFVPVTELSEECFESNQLFVEELYSIVFKRKYKSDELTELMIFESFASLLKNKQSVFLFFDGLDEHSRSYNLEGLKKIFCRLEYLDVDCLVSVRQEFWKERRGDLDAIFSNFKKTNTIIHLDEWDQGLVYQFIQEYLDQDKYGKNLALDDFKGKLNDLYSDIPKRPLFLNMIVRDVLKGNIEKRTLKELYQSYLVEKFERDRDGVFQDIQVSRPLGLESNHDRYEILQILWRVLKEVAGSMLIVQDDQLVLRTSISDQVLLDIIHHQGNILSIRDIVLNTVLIPLSYRNFDGITLHFAHKSFQEYYTALFLLDNDNTKLSEIRIPDEVKKFMH